MPQPARKSNWFSRLLGKFSKRKPANDWLENYHHEAAPVKDDLMDLNNVGRQ
jgi:hypothetical protein